MKGNALFITTSNKEANREKRKRNTTRGSSESSTTNGKQYRGQLKMNTWGDKGKGGHNLSRDSSKEGKLNKIEKLAAKEKRGWGKRKGRKAQSKKRRGG